MAGLNTRRANAPRKRTFEGAVAMNENPIKALERVLFAHMLSEDTFYLNGKATGEALNEAVVHAAKHDAPQAAASILAARQTHNIRHASLMAAVIFAKQVKGGISSQLICDVIQRADELGEVIAMGANGSHDQNKAIRVPLAIRRGVAMAFGKFDEYQFGKYKGTGKLVTLRDAVFITHPSPKKYPLVQKIVDDTLSVPDTWEVGLSAGGDKCKVFTDLLSENKLGAMALLRNLRNMDQAGVDKGLILSAMAEANWSRVLPFRFMSAAKHAPWAARMLDKAFLKAVAGSAPLRGRTAVLLDTSGSMGHPVSAKSTVAAYHAGATLAAAVNGDHVDLYQWASTTKQMANWGSLSTAMGIRSNEVGMGTNIDQAIKFANAHGDYDRLIVITDMQFGDKRLTDIELGQIGYTINVSPYAKAGLLNGRWTHLTGWSDSVLKYIASVEADG